MQLGIVGLGRMGGNIARRLKKAGHDVVVFDVDAKAVDKLAGEGLTGATGLEDVIGKLQAPRALWIMLPAGKITEETIATWPRRCRPATSSSTAAIPSTRTTSAAPPNCAKSRSPTSTSARPAACGGWSAAIA